MTNEQIVQQYKMGENTLFMTYATYWIKQVIIRYIQKCGSAIHISDGVNMESKTLQENGSESITGIKKKSNKKRNCCTHGNYVGRS